MKKLYGIGLDTVPGAMSFSPLCGLVLTGERCTRPDQVPLPNDERAHIQHCFEMLRPYCEATYLLNQSDPSRSAGHPGLPRVHDEWGDLGPIGGILSAFRYRPETAWLVVSCNLPFIDNEAIDQLIRSRGPSLDATCFLSLEDSTPEPMCAIYEPSCHERLIESVQQGALSPRTALMSSAIQGVIPASRLTLREVNSPEEYRRAVRHLHRQVTAG